MTRNRWWDALLDTALSPPVGDRDEHAVGGCTA
jgi:hypothetical protein